MDKQSKISYTPDPHNLDLVIALVNRLYSRFGSRISISLIPPADLNKYNLRNTENTKDQDKSREQLELEEHITTVNNIILDPHLFWHIRMFK